MHAFDTSDAEFYAYLFSRLRAKDLHSCKGRRKIVMVEMRRGKNKQINESSKTKHAFCFFRSTFLSLLFSLRAISIEREVVSWILVTHIGRWGNYNKIMEMKIKFTSKRGFICHRRAFISLSSKKQNKRSIYWWLNKTRSFICLKDYM